MTSVIRYIENKIDGDSESSKVNSTGSDYQLVAFSLVVEEDIPNVNGYSITVPLLTWTGAGTIKQVMNVDVDTTSIDEDTPVHLDIVINKNVIECILRDGETIKETANIRMLVVIGSY